MQDDPVDALAARIAALPGSRRLIGIAAPPGAGKSTLADALADRLPGAVVVPMDGFHLDNALLAPRGLLARKGAPETFDADGFVAMMERLRAGGEVVIPVFDRTRDLALAGARVVPATAPVLLVEGNYLLMRDAPWDRLGALFDLTVWLDVPMAVLEARLIARWTALGLDDGAAKARALGNDIPNARRVVAGSRAAAVVLRQTV